MVISTLAGSVFHLWRGGNLGRLVLYLILGWIGFWMGHFLALGSGISFGRIGPLYAVPGIIGSLLFLFVGNWLGNQKMNGK
jgi:hypothetical protein